MLTVNDFVVWWLGFVRRVMFPLGPNMMPPPAWGPHPQQPQQQHQPQQQAPMMPPPVWGPHPQQQQQPPMMPPPMMQPPMMPPPMWAGFPQPQQQPPGGREGGREFSDMGGWGGGEGGFDAHLQWGAK